MVTKIKFYVVMTRGYRNKVVYIGDFNTEYYSNLRELKRSPIV